MKLVIHNVAAAWYGSEQQLAILASGLQSRGHEVIATCRGGSPVEAEWKRRGIRTAPIRSGGYLDLPRAVHFARWLERERPDALLITAWKEMFWAAWAGHRAGVPRVVVRQGIVRALRHRRHALPFRRWVDAVIANAQEVHDVWLETAPWFPAADVHVIHNGIQPPPLAGTDTVQRFRESVSAGPETVLFVGVGHLSHRKGFDLLLDAFARAQLADARVVIVGSGPEEGALRDRAARLGIAERVHWLGHRRDVPEIMAACEVMVLSSRNDGMANVMLEAMAVGTPVIAAAISGVRRALGPATGRPLAGWIVAADDAVALADGLVEVADALRSGGGDPERRAAEASRRIREWFSPERMVEEVERVLFFPSREANALW